MSFIATGAVLIWAHDLLKCAVNVKFTNTMVIALSKVSVVLTATLLHRSFFFTAFEIDVLAELSNLLVIGAVPFSTYAASYNRRFQYCKVAITDDPDPRVKRMKRYVGKFVLRLFVMKVIPMRNCYLFLYFNYAL